MICGFRKRMVVVLGVIIAALLFAVVIATALAITFANRAKHDRSVTTVALSS